LKALRVININKLVWLNQGGHINFMIQNLEDLLQVLVPDFSVWIIQAVRKSVD